MKDTNKKCPNCGAQITSEVCPYCRNLTGLDSSEANMEYPVIKCKEANKNFWNTWFPMIFAVSFGFFGFIFPIIFILTNSSDTLSVILFSSIFAIIGVVAFIIALRTFIRYNLVKTKGKEIEATVYGYMNDNLLINEMPAQIVKLRVTTNDGPRFILYQLGDIKKPYKINSKIKLLVYKDMFMVKEDDTYHFE
ncbi:MAG: hypothetical protein IKJ43_02760 [Bacilli bacterium]|nr:hypothetical protein [Bacilli bacterium]